MVSPVLESLSRAGARHGVKLLRFGAVSAFNVVFAQAVLYLSQVALQTSPVTANTISVCVGAVPAYYLSRHWVWEKRGRSHLMREVVPFWALTVLGFALSTTAVWYVDRRFDAAPLVVNLTSLMSFGVVWLAKFFVMDRILFKPGQAPAV